MKFNYNRAIVTGNAGFIGSHIVKELVKLGVETISIDNYFAGDHENLAHIKNNRIWLKLNVMKQIMNRLPNIIHLLR
jgi:nucleoside-diphosphate-sugar epimerase